MDNQPAHVLPQARWFVSGRGWWCWPFFCFGFIRVRLLEMPLERDEGEYAYAGQLILQGIPPYELAYNMKLPGTYFAYAAGMAVFGQTVAGVHRTLLAANALTIIFVFLLGRKLFGVTAGLVACASYGVMSVSPAVLGLAAHATHFVVLFAVPATLAVVEGIGNKPARHVFFQRAALRDGFFNEAARRVLWSIWRGISRVAGCAWQKSIFGGFIKTGSAFRPGNDPAVRLDLPGFETGRGVPRVLVLDVQLCPFLCVALTPWHLGVQLLWSHLKWNSDLSAGLWFLAVAGLLAALRNRAIRGEAGFAVFFLAFFIPRDRDGILFSRPLFHPRSACLRNSPGACGGRIAKILALKIDRGCGQNHSAGFVRRGFSHQHSRAKKFIFQLPVNQVCEAIYAGEALIFSDSMVVAEYVRRTLGQGRPHRHFGFGTPDLFLCPASFRNRLHLHLCPDGSPALRPDHATRNDPRGDFSQAGVFDLSRLSGFLVETSIFSR